MKNLDLVEYSCQLAWQGIFDSPEQARRSMHILLGMRFAYSDVRYFEAHEYINTLFQLSQYIVTDWDADKQEWWND